MAAPSLPSLPPTLFDLSERTRIRVSGPDCLRYLHGQVSQDLRHIAPFSALPACLTNAKGRLQAELWISRIEPSFVVDSEPGLAESILSRLDRYLISDDVTLEDISGKEVLLHCCAEKESDLPTVLLPFPRVRAERLKAPGWDLILPLESKDAVLGACSLPLASATDWATLHVQRGIPRWGKELNEDTLPPEAGLEATHINYHKGCYIGQEVISRLRSVGHVNRSLIRLLAWEASAVPETGTELRIPASSRGPGALEVAGKITSAARLADGKVVALAYLKRGVEGEHFETESGIQWTRV
ncbi:MAG: hypothetical protein RLZZ399_1405 [Verrucomicrobiota bacterium]